MAAAQKVIFNAVLSAAQISVPKKPAASVTDANRKRMTFLDEQPETILGAMEAANAKGAGK